MGRFRKFLIGMVVADIIFTVGFWGLARLADETDQIAGGTGIVFYSDSAADTARRIEAGVTLLEAGQVERLVMVGGHRPQDGVLGSQQMALAAVRNMGADASRVSADVDSRDTVSGLTHSARYVEDGQPVVFVSNCMHVMRARTVYGRLDIEGPKARGACARSSYNPLNTWRRAHYEAAAWGLMILPESWRDGLLDRLRG